MKPFYNIVDKLYHVTTDWISNHYNENNPGLAFILGFTGAYGLTKGLQGLSKLVDKAVPGFDDKFLPIAEKVSIGVVTIIPLGYALLNKDEFTQTLVDHPVYSSGITGAILGGVYAADKDLQKRK